MSLGGMRVPQVQVASGNKHGQHDRRAGTDFDQIQVASVGPRRGGRRATPVGSGPQATEHGTVRNPDRLRPVNLAVDDGADMGPMGAPLSQPLTQLPGPTRVGRALANRRFDPFDGHRQGIPGFGPANGNGARDGIAEGHLGFVAAVTRAARCWLSAVTFR